jgi:hypothetical protein
VKGRLARWIFGLSRRSTRTRYRAEFEDLLDELIASGGTTRHLWLETASAAIRDRLRGVKTTGRVAFAGLALLATALAFMTVALGSQSPSSPPIASVAFHSIHLLPHPIDIPTARESRAASCPNPPSLSSPLPPGASISPPSLVPAGTAILIVAGRTYDLSGTCEYTSMLSGTDAGSG